MDGQQHAQVSLDYFHIFHLDYLDLARIGFLVARRCVYRVLLLRAEELLHVTEAKIYICDGSDAMHATVRKYIVGLHDTLAACAHAPGIRAKEFLFKKKLDLSNFLFCQGSRC